MTDRSPDLTFSVPGPPRGKGRPRSRIATASGGRQFVSVYTDAETRNYEAMLRFYGQQAMKAAGHTVPFNCPLRVRVTSVFPIPASWSPKKAVQADCGLVRPTVKPDWENLAKTLDGVNGVVWRDDSLIVEGIIHKLYGRNPMLTVEVWRWVPTHKQQEMPLVSAG